MTEVEYHREFYNKLNETEQWIRLSDGCYRDCWNCYCPKDKLWYSVPEIKRNKVALMDMNFIYAYPNPLKTIEYLGKIKVDKKVVYYGLICGLDFTILTRELIFAMKKARFGRFNNKRNYVNGLRFAWDRGIDEGLMVMKAIANMRDAGYTRNQVFMLVNGKVSYDECIQKMKILKDIRTEVCDCWFDNQKRGSIKPIYWTQQQCDDFGEICRAHNVAVFQKQYDALDKLYA